MNCPSKRKRNKHPKEIKSSRLKPNELCTRKIKKHCDSTLSNIPLINKVLQQ